MTCQSSLLIRVLNELSLPLCTLESDFQLPRQLQFIWLRARETALPYFSDSSALLKVEDTLYLKRIYSIPFYSIPYVCSLVWSYFLCWIKAREKKCISSANDLSQAEKRHPKYQPLYLCRRCYEFALQHHAVLKCHIQRLRSWYAEERIQQKHSGLDACQGAGAIKHKEWGIFCLITKGLRAVFVPVAVVCSSMSFPTLFFFYHPLPFVKLCVVHLHAVGRRDAWEINDAVQNLSEFISRPWSILATLMPLHLYCNDLSFLATAAICKSHARLINVVYTFSR